jgi:hippurate hydrolase
LLEQRIHAVVQGQAASFGVRAVVDYRRDYPVLVNSQQETEFARGVGAELFGEDGIERQGPAITGSEDFAVMLQHRPGSYVLIGNGAGDGHCMLHNADYDFNDEILAVGAAFWVRLTERFLCS